jgi:hypothetical protein
MAMPIKQFSLARAPRGAVLLILVLGLSFAPTVGAQSPNAANNPNVTTKAPLSWWKNGSKPEAYVVGVDKDNAHDGQPSAYARSIEPSIEGFGGMMQMCDARSYLGKRLRLSAWMRTEDAKDGGAHLWFRVDGKEAGAMLGFDNMDGRPVKGTTGWKNYSLVLDVPANAGVLAFGFFIDGTGLTWVSGVKLEEVGSDVPTTGVPEKKWPAAPVNLSFAD